MALLGVEFDEVLFPIAYGLNDTFVFAVSSTGKIYGRGVSDIFCGDSFEEFLSNEISYGKGHIKWIDNAPIDWTAEMDGELEQIYNALYSDYKKE